MKVNAETSSAIDSAVVASQLEANGFAVIPQSIDRETAHRLRAEFAEENRFRSTVVMERHGYGKGVYRYFSYPLPPIVASLRERLYETLVPVANDWSRRLGSDVRYPMTLPEMLIRCADAGQDRSSAILLKYGPGDYNALHQDLYGQVSFPLQATFLLSDPATEFTGGELVLYEAMPRRQSIAHVVPLGFCDCVVIPNRYRPNARGGRSTFRHGVSIVRSGERMTLGIILHDA